MMERLDAFMARANAAYYADHDPFADFATSPEISQVFGECLGLWAVTVWQAMGMPDPVLLAEIGPGRGTLMRDALRAIAQVAPAMRAALRLHLIETSPRLRAAQAALVADATFHTSADTLPAGPLLLLANEFLDALPIRQFVRRGTGWTERFVADGAFIEQPCPPPTTASSLDAPDGAVIEHCPAACAFVGALSARLARQGGAALLIDYGPEHSAPGDSLQALRHARPAHPLADPGQADLTAHVDFQMLAGIAQAAGAVVHGPEPQGMFLARLGLFQRTHRLAAGQPLQRAASLQAAAHRLAEPDQMGRLFKVLALCHPSLPQPAGFSA